MCQVCETNKPPLTDTLKPFLGKGVSVEFTKFKGGWQELKLTLPSGEWTTITAAGDEAAYFHWENNGQSQVSENDEHAVFQIGKQRRRLVDRLFSFFR